MKFCDRPFNFGYFTTGGEVWPCPWMHFTIGNLYEQDVDELWHSEAAQKARESILDGSFAYCRKLSCPHLERNDLPDLTEEELRERAVPTDVPEIINLCNDYTCNIACTKCRTSVYCPQKGEREKVADALRRLLPYANRARALSMNGRGEFLANPVYIQFLQDLKPERPDFHLGLETNGTLFDEEHWHKFSHVGKFHLDVTVTLDSMRREVYRYLSGGFDYLDRVLSNLRFLSRLRREKTINSLTLTMVVQECNFWEVPEYIRTFAHTEEYAVDQIILRPVYSWFGMKRDTYWFKNMLNPMHPYHQEYLRILEDDCWKDPKVYDWGCHTVREAREHPLAEEKRFARLITDIYANVEGLSPAAFVKTCLERHGIRKVGIYGENDYSERFTGLLIEAGADVAFKLTRYTDAEGEIPTVSMPNLKPDSADAILLMEFYDEQNRKSNLQAIGFAGKILDLAELIEAEET